MAINDNSLISYESAQAAQPWEPMSDSGDNQTFAASFSPFSNKGGFEPNIKPFGLATGGKIVPAVSANNDQVDIAALTAYLPGTAGADAVSGLTSVSAQIDVALTRAPTLTHSINSITVDATGLIAVVVGTEGNAFSETRGAAGGPPLIPVDSVEIGQVRLDNGSAAVVLATEIFQVVNLHQERYDFPIINKTDFARGEIVFTAVLPDIHTGNLPKQVWVTGYTPVFADLARTSNWTPAETTHSVNSTDTYDGPVGSVGSTIGQASFDILLNDGHTDPILAEKNNTLWFRHKQDRNRVPFSLTLGKLGIGRSFPVGDYVQATMTVSAADPTVDFAA